jgi:hypothetical protein
VQKSCSGAGRSVTSAAGATGGTALRGTSGDPLVIRVGVVKNLLYEVNAVLMGGSGASGAVSVSLEQGVPGPNGKLDNPMPADGAKIYVNEVGGTPVLLTGVGQGSGTYYSTGLTITPGKQYVLSVDGDGNGSIDGTGTVFAVGTPQWASPTQGASVAASGLTASWTDSASAVGGAAYAPVYYAAMSGPDFAYYVGTDRQFTPRSATSVATPPAPLAPGSYTASLMAFSGPYAGAGGNFTMSNNVTGQGVSGVFISYGVASGITFDLR